MLPAASNRTRPWRDILEQHRIGRRKRAQRRIAHLRLAADDDDLDRAFRLLPACRRDQRERRDQQQCQQAPHGGAFSCNDHSASVWIYRLELSYWTKAVGRVREQDEGGARGTISGAAAACRSRSFPTRSRPSRRRRDLTRSSRRSAPQAARGAGRIVLYSISGADLHHRCLAGDHRAFVARARAA